MQYRFKKGHVPWNKGTKGLMKVNSGSFKKGLTPWTKGKKGVCFNTGKTHFKKGMVAWNKGVPNPIVAERNRINNPIRSGKDHPRWKGNSTLNYRERRRFQKSMQEKVFDRDNYTCQICNTRGGILHVDHIQSFAEVLEGRFDMNNLRTLCVRCHYLVTFKRPMPADSRWGFTFMKGGD